MREFSVFAELVKLWLKLALPACFFGPVAVEKQPLTSILNIFRATNEAGAPTRSHRMLL